MNPNEFSIHDWQFKFNSNMIIAENTDEVVYAIQRAKAKGRLDPDVEKLIKKWLEHGGEGSHEAIIDFLNRETVKEINIRSTDAENIPPPEAAFSKAPYGEEIKSGEDLNKTELENN